MSIMELSANSRQHLSEKSPAMTLNSMPHSTPGRILSSHRRHTPGEQATEETAAEDDGLSLPIEPDEGTALIPDDERVVNVPS